MMSEEEKSNNLHLYHLEYFSVGYSTSKKYDSVMSKLETDFEMKQFFEDVELWDSNFYQFKSDSFLHSGMMSDTFKSNSLNYLDVNFSLEFSKMYLFIQFSFMIIYLSDYDGYLTKNWHQDSSSDCFAHYMLANSGKLASFEDVFIMHSNMSEMFNFFKSIGKYWFMFMSLGANHLVFSTYMKSKELLESLGPEEEIYNFGSLGPDFSQESGELEDLETYPVSISSGSVGSVSKPNVSGMGSFLFMDFFFYNISSFNSMLVMYGDLVKEDSLSMGIMMVIKYKSGMSLFFKGLEDEYKKTNFLDWGVDLLMFSIKVSEVSKTATTSKVFKWESCSKYMSSMDPYEIKVSK